MTFKIKYGAEISNKTMAEYFELLISKVFKLLPLYEQDCETLDTYLYSLLQELCGGRNLILDSPIFIELINNLESLLSITTHKKYKHTVLKCTNLCKKISVQLKGEKDNGI